MTSAARSHPRRRRIIWIAVAVVAAVVLVTLWVGVRGMMARDALLGAVPLVSDAKAAVLAGESTHAQADLERVRSDADRAASLTSDPVWAAVELVPGIGPNLRAFRQAAAVVQQVADGALPPIGELASTLTPSTFAPTDGAIDVKPLADAAPKLADARSVIDSARTRVGRIDTAGTLPQVRDAVRKLSGVVTDAGSTIDGLSNAARLLPAMLGSDSPRDYLLLSLNNAELRTTGGIPGALAVLHTDHGRVTLTEARSDQLGAFDPPALPQTEAETTLYQGLTGTYIQDVTMTPDFARSAQLAQAMWKQRTGQTVDGVVAIDPVALSYVLKAVGPVEASGTKLTAENAVDVLLSEVYARIPDPKQQDIFFAAVTKSIFARALTGSTDTAGLVQAVVRSGTEQRIHLWSTHTDEQKLIAGTTLATAEPRIAVGKTALGVYFNDGTGAKMDYYLRAKVGLAAIQCRVDGRPYFSVRVSLTSKAPADAATSLPGYVTGSGAFGVEAGTIRTNVFVHAPKGTQIYGATVDGVQVSFLTATDNRQSVGGVTVLTPPGKTSEVSLDLLAPPKSPTATTLQTTPMSTTVATSLGNSMSCPVIDPGHGANAAGRSGAPQAGSALSGFTPSDLDLGRAG